MCTSIALNSGAFYFGRNLDLEYRFGERVVITPRNYPFSFRRSGGMKTHYAMIGMAAVTGGYPLYAEAANECGLCMAGLNFPGNAFYPEKEAEGKVNLSPFELIPYLLGRCASVREARRALQGIQLVRIDFSPSMPLTPLHWHIADKQESIVLEPMRDGLHIHDNPVGVMTNNPPFDFHMTNLNQYLSLTSGYPGNRMSGALMLKPFGVGLGSFGLPGDFSPASRFVKTVFLKYNSRDDGSEAGGVSRFFHLLDAVAMPDGAVQTPDGKFEFTGYSCCMDAGRGIYYYKTYTNQALTAVRLHRADLDADCLYEYPLIREQQISSAN